MTAQAARYGLCALVVVAACRNRAPVNPNGVQDGGGGAPASEAGTSDGTGGMLGTPPCPANPPTAGAACPTGTVCQYGSDPRGRACRIYAYCGPANTWNVSVPTTGYPSYCVALNAAGTCPPSVAVAQGQTCATDLSFCDVGGTPCACTACTWNGGGLGTSCGTTLTWHCQTPWTGNSSVCPVLDPNLGASCSPEGLSCNYDCGPAGRYLCQGGYWIATPADPCPI